MYRPITSTSRTACALACTLLAAGLLPGTPLRAQDSPAARSRATELSRAWTAIGQGDYARAEQVAAALLRRYPSDHPALGVSIAAATGAGKPIAALDTYEQWLQRTRHEDVFLLQPIATSTLAQIGGSADAGLAVLALSKLAASEPDMTRAVLSRRTETGPLFDGVWAALGDKTAATRLVETLEAPSSREKLIALQNAAGVPNIPATAIAPLLTDPAPPVRAAAIETLARVQGNAALDTLRPLLADPDPFVQATAAVALGRLGDSGGLDALTRMLASDTGDSIAMAAAVLKERGVDVSAAVERVLADPNPLTRLGAIPLVSDPARAQALLSKAAADPNPVVRARAGQLVSAAITDLSAMRRLLRDPSPEVRLNAAHALIRYTSSR
jgi:HEAT repeat protein